ncbi:hypothetical protein K2173_018652 [Erythroxylum novogranatense]|uniref:Uncharacterized protein n=1 Tax=Erythroxylum novogranatense TaxID=1862640 RepID=A0AAV8SAD9_9ROSI|nr:hypothetical protein K2173_018652 [Erythroxylum novogranatense]
MEDVIEELLQEEIFDERNHSPSLILRNLYIALRIVMQILFDLFCQLDLNGVEVKILGSRSHFHLFNG